MLRNESEFEPCLQSLESPGRRKVDSSPDKCSEQVWTRPSSKAGNKGFGVQGFKGFKGLKGLQGLKG